MITRAESSSGAGARSRCKFRPTAEFIYSISSGKSVGNRDGCCCCWSGPVTVPLNFFEDTGLSDPLFLRDGGGGGGGGFSLIYEEGLPAAPSTPLPFCPSFEVAKCPNSSSLIRVRAIVFHRTLEKAGPFCLVKVSYYLITVPFARRRIIYYRRTAKKWPVLNESM